jgi:hypothetical protein
MAFFFLYKIGEQEGRTGPGHGVTSGRREEAGKDRGRMNTVQILRINVNGKMIPVETFQE